MDKNKYYFSVVMAVYNVEPYLREAVESLLHQTIGFSHIQLIMVDDGSTDRSGKICDAYKKKYPENIVVVHKKNGGVSSARNEGLKFVQGRYLNFMDSDDKFAQDAFEKVYRFFIRNEKKTDVVAVPMKFFEGQTGDHIQNYKFSLEQDILDLFAKPDVINLSASSSFVCTKSTVGLSFDTRLKNAEDAKYMMSVLLSKMSLGLVHDTTYWYRKRANGDGSAIQTIQDKYEWYIPYLHFFAEWALDTAIQIYGSIPKFVQYEVMYDLQWKFRKTKLPEKVLTPDEQKEYQELLFGILNRIDDDMILDQKNIGIDLKLYLLEKKHGQAPVVRYLYQENCNVGLIKNSRQESGAVQDIELTFDEASVCRMSQFRTVLDFVHLDCMTGMCTIEGYHVIPSIDKLNIKPALLVNGKTIACEEVDRSRWAGMCLGIPFNKIIGFKGNFKLSDHKIQTIPALCIDNITIERSNISVGSFFPVCDTYKNSYAIAGGYMISLNQGALLLEKAPGLIKTTVLEFRFLTEIWKKNLLGGRKAFLGRICYHVAKRLKRKKLWLISDRIMKADDNGEALFCYLMKNRLDGVKVVFAVSKDCPDYARIKRIGLCVDAMSFPHKMLHLLCDVNISSAAEAVTINPFYGHHDALRDILQKHFVFLQHGITKDDISGWLNRYNKDISGFVTAALPERQSLLDGAYYYPENVIWKTGFPRYDRLYHNECRKITLMPTWREYLMGRLDERTGQWTLSSNFTDSEYFHFYDGLINSQRLLSALEKAGYTLQFFPHPNLQPHIGTFHKNQRVQFLPLHTAYRDVYAESSLVITDYSSAVFDFSYLRKPVIYCQFDKGDFFKGQHAYMKGYFDYERDGFGEVAYDLDSTIDLIIEYTTNGCQLKDIYEDRINSFFSFKDRNNCCRVIEKILELPEKC